MYDPKTKSISILVVEDNPLDKLIVQTLLQQHFHLETVSNGYEALEIIEKIKFDIILMDIHLGDENMTGFDVMKLIKKDPKHQDIKIFAVTAYAENPELYIEQGFDELYIKPVIKEEMFEFLNKNTISHPSK
ncbi:MAG: response regulator [Bacteroidetes bacterium]|nr:response regulator [Bacteroidota bacterium]